MSFANDDDHDDAEMPMTSMLDDFTLGIIYMIEDGNSKADLEKLAKKYC